MTRGHREPEAKASLYSTIHGAGRLFGRKEAKRRFTRAEMDASLQSRGVTLVGAGLDESPMAYRRLPEVLARHAGSRASARAWAWQGSARMGFPPMCARSRPPDRHVRYRASSAPAVAKVDGAE